MDILNKGRRALRRGLPSSLKRRVKRTLWTKRKAEVANVYHCTTHKAASSWITGLLGDTLTFTYSGLDCFVYQHQWMEGRDPRDYDKRYFSRPFPKYTSVARLYWHYDCFRQLPKSDDYRAFYVLRDPRDVAVSWYFSMKNTHSIDGVEERRRIRNRLRELSKTEGLCFAVEWLADYGLFKAQRSWMEIEDPNVRVFKYENLTGPNQFQEMRQLFGHCTIPIPDAQLRDLLYRHGFETSEGRNKGEEDRSSHRRKGVAGDWRNHFDSSIEDHFLKTVGDLPVKLGYPSTKKG